MKMTSIYNRHQKTTQFGSFTICLSLMFTINGYGQAAPDIEWSKCYGGVSFDRAWDVIQDAAGNYLMCGWTLSNSGDVTGLHGEWDMWVMKTDDEGSLIWQNALGGINNDYGMALTTTPDGGCIVVGETASNDGDVSGNHESSSFLANDVWVVKLDVNGNLVWQKCMGSTGYEGAYDVIATSDGNYLLSGFVEFADGDVSTIKGGGDAWLVKFDGSGNILWEKTYGGTKSDAGGHIIANTAGGYSICGSSSSKDGDVTKHHGPALYPDIWVMNVDADGNLLSQKALGGKSEDYPTALIALADGSLLVAGTTRSTDGDVHGNHGGFDYWLVRLDGESEILWDECYGGTYTDFLNDFIPAGNGNYYLVGYASTPDGDVSNNFGGVDYWVVKIDGDGNIQWNTNYGGSNNDFAQSGIINSAGSLVLGGFSTSNNGDVINNHGTDDYWLVKTGTPSHSIITQPVTATQLCPGSNLNVSYAATGIFNPGNIFTVQLSNFYGEFITPYEIGTLPSVTSGTIHCKIPTVPGHDYYRVRVVSSDPLVYGFDNGEFISIQCPKPENLSVSGITATSATLNWDINTDCKVKFTVKYRNSNSGPWTTVNNVINNSITISNLTPSATYSWSVRTKCNSENAKSNFIAGTEFTTPPFKSGDDIHSNASGLKIYPNPFSESATIEFSIEKSSDLKIELQDLQGRKIKTLTKGNYDDGIHQLIFSAGNLPNGIYLLQLRTGLTIQTQKLIID